MPRWFDAHNHWQDHRLDPHRDRLASELPALGLVRAVVAGSGEDDWPEVAHLAQQHSWVLPSFGVHPWYVREQSTDWQEHLEQCLRSHPHAGVGEIGLDRWIKNADVPLQTHFFTTQLTIAAREKRAASIHCLQAWGLLDEVLRSTPRPERGFLLHSYGGPLEMVAGFVRLGARFSVSPYFLHARKAQQWQTFRHVPLDRLLIETDAPDMWPPDEVNPRPLHDAESKTINHPGNIELLYHEVAKLRSMSVDDLAAQVEQNFMCLFGIA